MYITSAFKNLLKWINFTDLAGADPENFSKGGGSNLKLEKTHYTHLNTSYLIVILWIDSV